MKSLEQQQLYENEKQELRNSLISDLEKDKIKYQCQIELNLNKLYSDKCSKIEEEYSNKLETFINQHKLDILNEPIIIEKMKELENEFQIKIDNINKELESGWAIPLHIEKTSFLPHLKIYPLHIVCQWTVAEQGNKIIKLKTV